MLPLVVLLLLHLLLLVVVLLLLLIMAAAVSVHFGALALNPAALFLAAPPLLLQCLQCSLAPRLDRRRRRHPLHFHRPRR